MATDTSNLEPAGAKVTAATMPAGGVGLTRWLSAIYTAALNPQTLSAVYNTETTTALGASATFTSGTRYGSFGSAGGRWAYFSGKFISDQAGTAYLDVSLDGANWFVAETAAVAAGGSLTLRTLMAPAVRIRFVNGGTTQAKFYAASSFTMN